MKVTDNTEMMPVWSCILTTVTHCRSASLIICSGVFRPYKCLI